MTVGLKRGNKELKVLFQIPKHPHVLHGLACLSGTVDTNFVTSIGIGEDSIVYRQTMLRGMFDYLHMNRIDV